MSTLQLVRDKRASAWAQAQEFNTRSKAGEAMSAEDEAAWERALAEVDSLGETIARSERTDALDAKFAEIDAERADRPVVPAGRGSDGTGDAADPEAAYRAAFVRYCRGGIGALDTEARTLLEANFRAQGVGTGAAGGFAVPEGFWAKVTETLKFYAPVSTIAEVLNTNEGNPIPWPTNDDTANVGELLAENTPAAEQDLVLGSKLLGAYMYSSKMVKVSRQLLQDAGIDIEGFLAKKLGQRLGRITNLHFTTGTGTAQPQGFITGATVGKTGAAGQTLTFKYDDLIDLIHSVDPAYRASPRCLFSLHDLTLAFARKIRDDSGGAGVGRPIWEPSVQAGQPDTLLGYGVSINNNIAVQAANAKSIAFGDFESAFVVRQVSGGQVLRLDERFAEALQVAFLGFGRFDSLTQDASAVKVYANSAT